MFMFVNWLKGLFIKSPRRKHAVRVYRPRLLALEARITPADITWVGTGMGNGALWSVATNWSPAQVPGSSDTVIFDGTAQVGANTNSRMNLGGGVQYHIGRLRVFNYSADISLNNLLYVDVLEMNAVRGQADFGSIREAELRINQRTGGNPAATIFQSSYWLAGTIKSNLSIRGEALHQATLLLGAPPQLPPGQPPPAAPVRMSLLANFVIEDTFSTVNWVGQGIHVPPGKTVTNHGTFLADSPGGTMGNNLGAMNRWTFRNERGGRLLLGTGNLVNVNQPMAGGRTFRQQASLGPDAPPPEIVGLVSIEDPDSALTVESGTLLISGTLTQSAGDVTVSEGTTLDVTEDYTQSGGTVADNGSLTVNGQYLVNGGTVSVGGGTIEAAASMQLAAGAFFSGSGTILANVTNAGDFDTGPALNPGSITVTGNYTQTAGTTTVTGGLTVSGTVQLAAGSFLVSGPWTPPFAVGAFAQTGGTFSLLAGALNVSGDYTQSGGAASIESSAGSVGGQLLLSGGTLSLGNVYDLTVTGGVQIDEGATLELVEGRMVGNVTNEGTLSLGSRTTPAAGNSYTIVGNYTQTATGLLIVDAGPWDVDHLSITGVATLAGTFQLVLVDEYEPALGTALAVLDYGARSGLFTSYGLPGLPAGVWEPRYDDPAFPNSLSLWVIE